MQSDRPVSVVSPLGDDVLLFHRMTASESLGRLYEFDLDVLSEDFNVKLEDLLGQPMTVTLELPGAKRHFHGIVSRLAFAGARGRYARYNIRLSPGLWFLTRAADCRIFQNMKLPDIIKEVLGDFGFTDIEDSLSGKYVAWDYCVQYRETAFNFISRLMEQEGIYYYFKHDEDKHTLVLADSYSAHDVVDGYGKVPFYPPEDDADASLDRFLQWSLSQQVQSTSFTLDDYDFEAPKSDLMTNATADKKHSGDDFKIYDYPGEYPDTAVGNEYVKYRMEELKSEYEICTASGTVRGLMAGCLFTLTDHPRDDQNKEYLVVSATHTLESGGYETGESGSGEITYSGSVQAIDAQVPYRSPRATPKPLVQGPQTAVVVGSSGEEIWTDQYGRVKLQFHWDRYGESNEDSSCWVRVAQVWAGKTWGAIHIPRMGQEVIVEFLEGDPDRPIVTGRVYNADNMPPYGLPDNQTQSGIKSRSTKGGGGDNFNEIRMEDKKDSEELYIHAEKDENIVVENDKTENVGHDETISIGNDRTEEVGNNETITIGNDRVETVNNNETLTVVADRTRNVNSNETVTVALMRTHNVGVNEAITVGAAQEVTVGAVRTMTVGVDQTTTIGANHTESVGADHTVSVSKNQQESVGENRGIEVGEDDTLKVGKNLTVEAGDAITLKTGKATISMKKDGTISIDGKDITINGSGEINVKASKDITLKGKSILQN